MPSTWTTDPASLLAQRRILRIPAVWALEGKRSTGRRGEHFQYPFEIVARIDMKCREPTPQQAAEYAWKAFLATKIDDP